MGRIRRLGDDEPVPSSAPRRYKSAAGYIRLRWRVGVGEYVEAYEHRIVMGRPEGQVHHRNGVKDDNRPENLEVLTPAQHRAEHSTYSAGEIRDLYEQGLSTPAIAARLGCDAATAYRAVKRAGGTPRSISEAITAWHRNG